MKTSGARSKANGGIVRGSDRPFNQVIALDLIAGGVLIVLALILTIIGISTTMGTGGLIILIVLYGFGAVLLVVPTIINAQRK